MKFYDPITTRVTKIDNRYHCRILNDDKVCGEMACVLKEDISYCFRYLLRMYDKCGGNSKMADASRHRGKNLTPSGKIWYPSQMPVNKK